MVPRKNDSVNRGMCLTITRTMRRSWLQHSMSHRARFHIKFILSRPKPIDWTTICCKIAEATLAMGAADEIPWIHPSLLAWSRTAGDIGNRSLRAQWQLLLLHIRLHDRIVGFRRDQRERQCLGRYRGQLDSRPPRKYFQHGLSDGQWTGRERV